MSTWGVGDFAESIERVQWESPPVECVAAWGEGLGDFYQGDDADISHLDSHNEWIGVFVVRLEDDRYAILRGWCDYSGWGCQDGAEVEYFDSLPDLSKISTGNYKDELVTDWDLSPIDVARWFKAGQPDHYQWDGKVEALSD